MGYSISKQTWILTGIMILSLILSGCAAVHTSIAKKDLDVQTKMSDSIFLDPVEPSKKIIYLNIRNTSDKTNFDIYHFAVLSADKLLDQALRRSLAPNGRVAGIDLRPHRRLVFIGRSRQRLGHDPGPRHAVHERVMDLGVGRKPALRQPSMT